MTLTHDHALTHRIIGLAMRVHTRLGPGLLETAYERCLCYEFQREGLPFRRQVDLPLTYDDLHLDRAYRADLIISDTVLLEVKSVATLLPLHEAQILTYLRMSRCAVALLVNFNVLSLKDGLRRRTR